MTNDFGIVRTSGLNKNWYLLNSNFGYGFVYGCGTAVPICGNFVQFGTNTDRVVSGDFDGDARTDIAVYRASDGTWQYLRSSLTGQNVPGATALQGFNWGLPGDIPQPADFDGDKRTDFAVFRPTTGVWYLSNSNNGAYNTFSSPSWGGLTDQPASSPFRITNP